MARKKIVKPTLKEAKIIKARLQRQYPQMFEYPAAERAATKHLSKADQEAVLERTTKKRLKAIYKSNK